MVHRPRVAGSVAASTAAWLGYGFGLGFGLALALGLGLGWRLEAVVELRGLGSVP